MAHVFSAIPKANIPRSMFRRNHNLKTTINTDYLYPIYVDEALPGDTFKFKEHLFARLATPLTPVMDNIYLDTFFFAIPVRLVDKDFKKLMGERPFGDVRNDYTVPTMNIPFTRLTVGSLHDYLGLPIGKNVDVCPWWHRAYNLVWNEFFRDENLVPAVKVAGVAEDGTVSTESALDYTLLRRGKRKDYFTGCLPWPQKGSAVTVPLGDSALVYGTDNPLQFRNLSSYSNGQLRVGSTQISAGGDGSSVLHAQANSTLGFGAWPAASVVGFQTKSTIKDLNYSDAGLYADLSTATASTINQLREAFAIQRLLETDARGGTRYIELIRAHFNVISPDARLQRPEYLGGASRPLSVNTVAQTSETTSTSPQGNLAAFITANHNCSWIKSFTEHTLLIGLANIRADLSYQQGLPRMFTRKTKYDFYWPELANLGEQVVFNKEIYCQGKNFTDSDNNVIDDQPFGYQERWAEYRYHPNMITGQFRSTASTSLDYWHLAQNFTSLPTLGQTFIEEHVPIDRVLAVSTSQAPNMILDGWFEVNCARPMPVYSVPGLGRL